MIKLIELNQTELLVPLEYYSIVCLVQELIKKVTLFGVKYRVSYPNDQTPAL